MKNPLITVSELFGAFRPSLLAAVTLDCCYDHVHEDFTIPDREATQIIQHSDSETPGAQEMD